MDHEHFFEKFQDIDIYSDERKYFTLEDLYQAFKARLMSEKPDFEEPTL